MELIVIKEDCFKLVCIVLSGEFVEVNFTDNLVQDRSPSRWVQLQPMLVPIAPQHSSNCAPQLPLFFFNRWRNKAEQYDGTIEKLIKKRIAAQSLAVYNQWQLRCAFSWLKHCPDVHHRFALRGAFLKWLMLNQPRKILQLGNHNMRIFGVAQIQGQHWWAFSGWKRYAEMDADHMVVVRQLPEQSTCFLLWTMRVIKFYKIRKMVKNRKK